jgi:hypothetical protein
LGRIQPVLAEIFQSERNIEKEKGEEEIKNNKEVFDKLFVMMEKMTERIIHMESKMEKNY